MKKEITAKQLHLIDNLACLEDTVKWNPDHTGFIGMTSLSRHPYKRVFEKTYVYVHRGNVITRSKLLFL